MRSALFGLVVLGLMIMVACKPTKQVQQNNQPLLSRVTTLEHKQKLFENGYAMYGVDLADQWKLFMNPDSVVAIIADDVMLRSVMYGKFPNQWGADTEIYQPAIGWKITWVNQPCYDSASKQDLRYQVSLQKDTQVLHGCGSDVYDTRINGKWALTHIKGNLVPNAHTDKALQVEINAEQGRITGKLSCNRLDGPIYIRRNKIKIHEFAATRIACHDVVENIFLTLFKNLNSYSIQDGSLVITNTQGYEMRFERLK